MDGEPIRLFPSLAEEDSGPLVASPREFAAIEAVGVHGDNKLAARHLGITEAWLERLLQSARDKNRATTKQLVWRRARELAHNEAA